ncbi:MAG: TaqI-like C-terminal specificity domain-containing protein [Bacteroidota bacterium]|nr:TaqI-like C-terminal specificity domain-containing protein [Bacteroidota bacterium]
MMDKKTDTLTIREAALQAHVSTITIRNWIKSEYLPKNEKGEIPIESFEYFQQYILGKEKLSARANKLRKDSNEQDFISVDSLLKDDDLEAVSNNYQQALGESYRNKEGIFYTPQHIVTDMFADIEMNRNTKFLDPCCGSGNFLIEAMRRGVAPENIYGYDTDQRAIEIAKYRIKKEFGIAPPNLKVFDFLEQSQLLEQSQFKVDLIFTNPPWGKKMFKDIRKKYAKMYQSGNSIDSTALFMAASMPLLNPNGILAFLVQEAFYNIGAFEDIRNKILQKKILKIKDYGKPFKGLLTKAQAITIQNAPSNNTEVIPCVITDKMYYRTSKSFVQNPKKIINFWTNTAEDEVIKRLFEMPHQTLEDRAKWVLGIVTGNNKKYCKDTPHEGFVPIYRGLDIFKNEIKEPSTFIATNFSQMQQVAPMDLYQAEEKIIYRFISSSLCFAYDNKQRLLLNSANAIVPFDLDINNKQLTQLLNSNILNWLFRKMFSTSKILRKDLEKLPIHSAYFAENKTFSEQKYLDFLGIRKNGNSYSVCK